jgi:beta-lactamase regulating signal transducer with metallopeptidase domain
MNHFIDAWLSPGVWMLGGWSLRWGIFIALVALWFAVRSPRHPATRDAVWRTVLVAGLLLLPSAAGFVVLIRPSTTAAQRPMRTTADVTPAMPPSAADPSPSPAVATQRAGPKAVAASTASSGSNAPRPAVPAEPLDAARMGALLLAGAWAFGVVWYASRLLAGWRWLARFSQRARAPGEAAQRQFEACRQESGVGAKVVLGIHAQLRSPIYVGGWKRRILVPDHWDTLPAAVRRGILLHELAHVARRDDQMKLLEEVVRVFFFFHPLVRYLLNRLDSEREEICDAAAVRQGVNPRALAQILLEYGRQTAAQRPLASAGALQFFRPHALKKRIAGLLDHQAIARWNRPPSRLRTAAAMCLAVVLLLVARGVVLRAADPPTVPPAAPPASVRKGQPAGGLERVANPTGVIEGQLVDVTGRPVKNAKVSGTYSSRAGLTPVPDVTADEQGVFQLSPVHRVLPFSVGGVATLNIVTEEGQSFEANVIIEKGRSLVHVPTILGAKVDKIEDVAVGELAGTIVDEHQAPLEGVTVNVGYAHNGHETETDAKGQFRLKGFERDEKVEVILSKPGYSPETFMQQPTGVPGWVVALGTKTYFEGTVRAPGGQPAAGVLVRANQGPKRGSGFQRSELWTETKTDKQGRYRLYVQPDAYELAFEAGVGVDRFDKRPIGYGKVEVLDVDLAPGITFRANCVDAATGEPVPGVRSSHWRNKKANGLSGADGTMVIGGLLPGRFEFNVEAKGYARWWSQDALSLWNRKSIDEPQLHWQRNFDSLDFDLSPDMAPVTVVLERAARIRGRVVDPDGNPVAGATAAPALTGTGNSLTGDTRFSVTTGPDGTFDMWLPASNGAQYNLVAHDGKYQQWRKWANGTLPPIRTMPGQEIEGVEIRLTRPATVRGIVLDEQGKPVAYREVRAHAADKLESRYYDPTVKTKKDGTFELPFIRPGEQYIQAAPFWLTAEQAPQDATKTVTLEAGQTREGIELIGHEIK